MEKETKLRPWTVQEIKWMIKNGGNYTAKEIAEKLNRTVCAVRSAVYEYGFDYKRVEENKWTDEELTFLADNYQTMTDKEIAKAIGRTKSSILNKRSELGYIKQNIDRKWTLEELNWLSMHYIETGVADSAAHIGRSKWTIMKYCSAMGISNNGKVWTQDDIDMFELLYPHVDDNTISKIFRCPESAVSKRAALMGLTKDYDDTKGIRRAIKAVMDMTLDELFDALDKEERIIKLTQWINNNAYGHEKRT